MIRWSFLKPRLAVLALAGIFLAFFLDSLARRALERAASRALGARVTIGALHTHLFPPSVTLRRVAAADPESPMRNLVEFRLARFALQGRPLLEQKLVITRAGLEGLSFGRPRRTSGALPDAPPSPAAAALGRWTAEARGALGSFGASAKADLTAQYKVDPEQLSSVRLARELEGRWSRSAADWKAKADGFDAPGKVRGLEALLEKAKAGGPAERLAAAAELPRKAAELRAGLTGLSDGFKADLARARSDLSAVQRAKDEDLGAVAAKLKLPVFDAEHVTGYLVGPTAAAWASRAARLAAASRAAAAPAPKPVRRGVNVRFPREHSWPAFWLRRMTLSGMVDLGGPLEVRGEALDIASEPRRVGEPARLTLAGTQGGRSLDARVSADHRTAAYSDALEAKASGVPFPATRLGEGPVTVDVGPGAAELRGRLVVEAGGLSGEFAVRALPTSLTARVEGADPLVSRALGEALSGLKVLELSGKVSGTPEEPRLALSSNLGEAAGGALKRALGREAEARLAGVRAQIDKAAVEQAGPLAGRIDAQGKEVLAALGLGDEKLKAFSDRVLRDLKPAGPPIPGLDRLFK